MRYNPDVHHRHSIRLRDYDYSKEGMYFITICTQNRECILGQIINNANVGAGALVCPKMILSQYGKIIEKHINRTNGTYRDITIDQYVIMPNHLHFIITIDDKGLSRAPTPTNANAIIPSMISMLKRFTNKDSGKRIWQRNYYERIIRDEKDYYRICEYIENNPANWIHDKNYIENI